ncbi:MAG: hypothetical protein KME60_28215 [Cyanomargarita calcarea GSE-NOS-MK-12-04C]|jgi:hypothetical protein|uniref:Uncharacterized protein n=1 Tax=Cyanomargarita calcarea GSE-NOS-MK-12-04C TaxID=2839659 RepID=A0A951UV08_9CYAN|nr:hypothetical protein [Cyanomargarita calcarea GSE-NOS-MK-12-04C]
MNYAYRWRTAPLLASESYFREYISGVTKTLEPDEVRVFPEVKSDIGKSLGVGRLRITSIL